MFIVSVAEPTHPVHDGAPHAPHAHALVHVRLIVHCPLEPHADDTSDPPLAHAPSPLHAPHASHAPHAHAELHVRVCVCRPQLPHVADSDSVVVGAQPIDPEHSPHALHV